MNGIWKSATYQIVKAMRATGKREGVIAEWKAGIEAWALVQPPSRDVLAVRAWLPLFQVRPFYTAAELAPLLPALAAYLGFKELHPPRSARRVENRLTFVGLPVLRNKDGHDTFVNPATGRYERYFIVEKIAAWSQVELSQEEFENVLASSAQH